MATADQCQDESTKKYSKQAHAGLAAQILDASLESFISNLLSLDRPQGSGSNNKCMVMTTPEALHCSEEKKKI